MSRACRAPSSTHPRAASGTVMKRKKREEEERKKEESVWKGSTSPGRVTPPARPVTAPTALVRWQGNEQNPRKRERKGGIDRWMDGQTGLEIDSAWVNDTLSTHVAQKEFLFEEMHTDSGSVFVVTKFRNSSNTSVIKYSYCSVLTPAGQMW